MSLTCTLKQILVNYGAPKHAKTQPLHYSNTNAQAPNLISSQNITVDSRASYQDNVTVYPYNGYIQSTNPIVRHVTSLTRTLKQILVNYGAQKHAKTQPLHGSNTHARAPNLMPS